MTGPISAGADGEGDNFSKLHWTVGDGEEGCGDGWGRGVKFIPVQLSNSVHQIMGQLDIGNSNWIDKQKNYVKISGPQSSQILEQE